MSFPFQPSRNSRCRKPDQSSGQLSLFDLLVEDGAQAVSAIGSMPVSSLAFAAPASLLAPLPPIAAAPAELFESESAKVSAFPSFSRDAFPDGAAPRRTAGAIDAEEYDLLSAPNWS